MLVVLLYACAYAYVDAYVAHAILVLNCALLARISTWKTLFEFSINNRPLRVKYLLNFNSLLLSKNSSGELRNWAWSSAKVGVAQA